MLLVVRHRQIILGSATWPCAIGRSGVTPAKREGDGATPIGCFPLRQVLYRRDRVLAPPACGLPVAAIHPDDVWCDDPNSGSYNQPGRAPVNYRHERLWRSDGLYDVVVIIGYNDQPPIPNHGSAIFLHVARPDWAPTEGCVAMEIGGLLELLAHIDASVEISIEE